MYRCTSQENRLISDNSYADATHRVKGGPATCQGNGPYARESEDQRGPTDGVWTLYQSFAFLSLWYCWRSGSETICPVAVLY
jgi:hypothetical protein